MSQTKTIGHHATSISTYKDMVTVTYHNTEVVKFDKDDIILNTGEYFTNTTKVRMNQASNQYNLGYRVFQVCFKWFVWYNKRSIPFENNSITLRRA